MNMKVLTVERTFERHLVQNDSQSRTTLKFAQIAQMFVLPGHLRNGLFTVSKNNMLITLTGSVVLPELVLLQFLKISISCLHSTPLRLSLNLYL